MLDYVFSKRDEFKKEFKKELKKAHIDSIDAAIDMIDAMLDAPDFIERLSLIECLKRDIIIRKLREHRTLLSDEIYFRSLD